MFRWSDFWDRNAIWQGTIVKSVILLYLFMYRFIHMSRARMPPRWVALFFASVDWACFGEAISEIEMPYFIEVACWQLKNTKIIMFQFNFLYFIDSNRWKALNLIVFNSICFIFSTQIAFSRFLHAFPLFSRLKSRILKKIRPGSSITFFHLLIFVGV